MAARSPSDGPARKRDRPSDRAVLAVRSELHGHHNPTISFYEKTGGKFNNQTKKDVIGGKKVTELCYIWDDINF